MSPEERGFLNSKFCKTINRLDHFCCGTETKFNEDLNNPISSHLPSAPDCGIYFHDKVSLGWNLIVDPTTLDLENLFGIVATKVQPSQ